MVVILGDMLEPISSGDTDNQVIHRCATWPEFQQLAPTSAIAIIVEPELSSEVLASLRSLRNNARSTALILVTSAAPDNTRHLASVLVDQIVWQHEPLATVRAAIRRAQESDLLHHLAEQIKSAPHLPDVFTDHILKAVRADPPFRTVKRWGHVSGRTPRELQKQWRVHIGEGGSPREFLRLLYTIRASGSGADVRLQVAALAACRELLKLE